MARLMQMTTATFNRTDMSEIYMIDSGVGPGRANRRDDVMLVQLLLKKAGAITLSGGMPGLHQSALKVDGIFGPMTERFIQGFESMGAMTRRLGTMQVVADGGFDPLPANGAVQSSGGLWYKIFAVNVQAMENLEHSSPGYNNLALDPQTPPSLRVALRTNHERFAE